VGVGHTSAAVAVKDALLKRDPAVSCQIVNCYKYAASIVSRVVSDGYIGMVKTIPQMYRFLYSRAERATEIGPFRSWVHQFTATNLRALLQRTQPDVVVCTHAFPCGVMSEYKKQFADAPPVIGIVTDFVVHSFWIHRNIDAYAVATPEMRSAMAARGVARDRVFVAGIPVAAGFRSPPADRDALREELGLPPDRCAVLMMGGGLGIGPLEMMMRALGEVKVLLAAIAIVGRNARMQRRVIEAAQHVNYPLRVLSFVDNVSDYMHAADVLLSKPGGLTSAEALVAGIPMVLVKPLPGQEERNTRYLVDKKAALRSKSQRELTRMVAEVLGSPSLREQMQRASAQIAMPGAADDIAALVYDVASTQPERMHHAIV
jgi:processive 1,2-diacylglycerol beta-glucosyltransferase